MRYGGAYKSYGPQYVRGIQEMDGKTSDGNMWVTYSMNKEEIVKYTYTGERKVTPKYTIVQRCIHPIYKDKFKPDYDVLWYFRSKSNAEYLKNMWERQDRESDIFHRLSDFSIAFNR